MAHESSSETQKPVAENVHEREIRECITHDRPVTSGSNALIFKTTERKSEDSLAVKVLKVYRAGAGEKEFATLHQAYELLSKVASAAQVPRPQNFVVLPLSDNERDRLNSFGAHLLSSQPVEAFDMTFIEGKDFARIVYEEVIRRCTPHELLGLLRENEEPAALLEESASLDYLFEIVRHVLKLENPMRVDASGVPQNDMRVLWRNSKRIFEFLSARGFIVHPTIVQQLQQSVDILHAHGIRHNDLHERNIMIEGRIDSSEGKVWLLDFGMSHDEYSELQSYRDDYSLVRLLESCQKTKQERVEMEVKSQQDELAKEVIAHTSSPMSYGIFMRYTKFGSENIIELVARSLVRSMKPKFDLAAIKLLCDNDVITAHDAQQIIRTALTLLTAKNTPATKSKSASIYNPSLQGLLRLADGLWMHA
ncbi:MAG: hypothetical protein KBC02_02395 [Candidatus Pacebacteria bacterium]|nr:hypothetical protein [Candidatus Paceibacterota bacterium]